MAKNPSSNPTEKDLGGLLTLLHQSFREPLELCPPYPFTGQVLTCGALKMRHDFALMRAIEAMGFAEFFVPGGPFELFGFGFEVR